MAGTKVAAILLLLCFLVATLATHSSAQGAAGDGEEACCDMCVCTRSIPPQCRCTDVRTSCPSSCNSCICNRKFPPDCRCNDIKDYCDKPCTAAAILKEPL